MVAYNHNHNNYEVYTNYEKQTIVFIMPIPSNLPIYPDICEDEDNEGDIVVKDRVDDLDKISINIYILYNDITDSDEVDDIHNIHSERGHTRASNT